MISGMMKLVLLIVGLVVVGLGVSYAALGGQWFWTETTADIRGGIEQREITNADGTYRIEAYEQFYEMCASVQADEQRIKNLEEELDTADEARTAQLEASLTALRNSRAEKITEYNAEARMEATVAQFRASDLPGELSMDGKTTCTVE